MDDNKKIQKVTDKATLSQPNLADDIFNWALKEFIVPKAKDICHDLVSGIWDMIGDAIIGTVDKTFYGDDYRPRSRSRSGPTSYTSYYNNPTQSNINASKPSASLGTRSVYDNYVQVEDRETAERIRGTLIEWIDNYGKVRVGDLYEAAGLPTASVDWAYGWTNRNDIRYSHKGRFYVFDLPRPISLKDR